jgi:hypothetical protein
MQYALPHPGRTTVIPVVALVIGSAGGAAAATLLNDADTVRIAPAPSADSSSPAPGSASVSDRSFGARP